MLKDRWNRWMGRLRGNSRGGRVFRFLWKALSRLAICLFLLLLILYLLLQLKPVREFLLRKVDQALEKRLETEVRIDALRLPFFDDLELSGFVIEGFTGDTLIHAGLLTADLSLNPVRIIRKGLVVEGVRLRDAGIIVKRMRGEADKNLNVIMARLANPDRKKRERSSFQVEIGYIDLENIQYAEYDELKGKDISIHLNKGIIDIKETHWDQNKMCIGLVDLVEPRIRVLDIARHPLPDSLIQEEISEPDTVSTPSDTLLFTADIDQFNIRDAQLEVHNYRRAPVKTTPEDQLDFKHMEVLDINMDFKDFVFDEAYHFEASRIDRLSFRSGTGFVVENITSSSARVTPEKIALHGVKVKTTNSEIGDTLEFNYSEYPDFFDFPNLVELDARLQNTRVALRDIMVFAPDLERSRFFSQNRNEVIRIDGHISGTINQLEGRNLDIRLEDGSIFQGRFSTFNLAVKDEEFMDFSVDRLSTSMSTLKNLVPRLDLSSNFDRLGQLNFKGSFLGFFHDFVAYGYLNTDIGDAQMDLQLSLTDGRENASYSGGLSLIDFDLAQWLDNRDFGKVNAVTKIDNGRGLTGESVDATLSANVSSFYFKNYNYQNAEFKGKLNRNLLDGDFLIQDDNIDFLFNGRLNFSRPVSKYRFNALINRLDLKSLNLGKRDLVLSGRVDLNLSRDDLSKNVTGDALISDFKIIADQNEEIRVSRIFGQSTIDSINNRKLVTLESDVLDGEITGDFSLDEIPQVFQQFLRRGHPEAARRLGIDAKEIRPGQSFAWQFDLKQTNGLNYVIHPSLGEMSNIEFVGGYDGIRDSLKAVLNVPQLSFDKVVFTNIDIYLDALEEEGDLDFSVENTVFNEKQSLEPVKFLSIFYSDTAQFALNYSASESILDNLNLSGTLYPYDSSYYEFRLSQSNLTILKNFWLIDENNFLRASKDSIRIRDFRLANVSNDKEIRLESFGKSGLDLQISNADFHQIDNYWDYDPLDFFGEYDLAIRVGELFKMKDISLTAASDTLLINGDDWGAFRLNASVPDLRGRIDGYLSITKGSSQILAEGFFNLADLETNPQSDLGRRQYFDFTTNIADFPLSVAEYFIPSSISNTTGAFDADLRFYGFGKTPRVSGTITANGGAVTVNYLKTRYFFDRHVVQAGDDLFDASGLVVKDKYGNEAVLQGGVVHTYLKELGFDAVLETPRFLALDTKRGDNDLFFGHAMGRGRIQFTGTFQQPNVYVNGEVGEGTKLTIPLDSEREVSDLKYIRILEKPHDRLQEEQKEERLPPLPKGVSLEMDLTINEKANAEIIFDEQAGDIIRGNGRGNLRILTPRTGEFEMYGEYIIEQGEYLFTLYNLVNKKFTVKQGGRISWSGDPYAANIDLEAQYSDISASVANLIQEYLVNASQNIQNNASLPTPVELKLLLTGELLRPIINFGIELPQLKGLLETYVDNKLRLLERDQNELYKQVFGLISMGQFLPSELDFRGAGNDIIYNTLSELVSNQLSLLITELFSELIEDGSVLSGIDFDVKYNPSQRVTLDAGQAISAGDELELRLRQDFFNDRLSIIVGGNIDLSGNISAARESSGSFIGNDLVIEYVLNTDRTLKLRIYQRLLPDIGGGSRLQLGTGLSFRKEFDNFREFFTNFKKDAKKNRQQDR